MEMFALLFMAVVSVLFGIILTLVIQYYVLIKYFNKEPIVPAKKINHEAYCLPEALKKSIDEDGPEKSADSSLPINLVLQFLFHELRHSDAIKRWLYKKLSMEFDELLRKTTIGKFFETVKIRDMNLGNEFPDIQSLKLESVTLDKYEGHIDTVNLSVKVDYSGNFMLSVDAKMKFGKTAYLSIKVKRVSGLARLQFTRIPYTHWSLSFYTEPSVEVAVESRLRGRQLQAHVHGLVAHQIKKAIRRKHTLPNYKIRYRPFFIKTDPGYCTGDNDDEESAMNNGKLEVTCTEISRLAAGGDVVNVYCTFAISDITWVSLTQGRSDGGDSNYTMIADITVRRNCDKQRTLGAGFRAAENSCGSIGSSGVIVDFVDAGGAASKAGLRLADHVLAIEGRTVSTASVTQVARLIRSSPATTISLRVQRKVHARSLIQTPLVDILLPTSTEPAITVSLSETGGISSLDVGSNNISGPNADISTTSLGLTIDGNFVMVDHDAGIDAPVTSSTHELKRKITSDRLTSRGLLHSGNESVAKIAAHTFGSLAALRKRKSVSLDRNASNPNPTTSNNNIICGGSPSASSASPSPASASAQSTPQHQPNLLGAQIQEKHLQQGVNDLLEKEDVDCGGDMISLQETKHVDVSSVMQFKDEFIFDVKSGTKYLNINVWGTTTNSQDILLGYSNILLDEVLNECRTSMLGHYVKRYWFLPPNNTTSTIQSHPLMSHSGFEHVFCYGDILLSFVWNFEEGIRIGAGDMGRKFSASSACDGEFGDSAAAVQPSTMSEQEAKTAAGDHDFIRTQFHRSVHCDFCSKRIWLKDAVQCRNCALCCHRKCVSRCQQGGAPCTGSSVNANNSTPEIITTEPIDCNNTSTTGGGTLKRVNSASNLITLVPPIGGGATAGASLSLPPSPQRRRSLAQEQASEPFALCPLALRQLYEGGGVDAPDARETLDHVLEQLMQWPADDLLMAAAKETGKQMYRDFGAEERADKIGAMVAGLKRIFDASTEEHAELQRSLGVGIIPSTTHNIPPLDAVNRTRAAFLLGQADAKMQALSVLMLHYCSALQQTHDKII